MEKWGLAWWPVQGPSAGQWQTWDCTLGLQTSRPVSSCHTCFGETDPDTLFLWKLHTSWLKVYCRGSLVVKDDGASPRRPGITKRLWLTRGYQTIAVFKRLRGRQLIGGGRRHRGWVIESHAYRKHISLAYGLYFYLGNLGDWRRL